MLSELTSSGCKGDCSECEGKIGFLAASGSFKVGAGDDMMEFRTWDEEARRM